MAPSPRASRGREMLAINKEASGACYCFILYANNHRIIVLHALTDIVFEDGLRRGT
jgi:hypothetical protein